MQGAFKVPGGKLVVVSVDVIDGKLANAQVSGDFFLEPDQVLWQINSALNGINAGLNTEQIASHISGSIDKDAVLIGVSAEAIAVATRRAIAGATNWKDYDWELIHSGPQDPHMQLALDQVLTEEVAAGRRKPTLRIWEWDKPAIVIGSFQSVRNEVDTQNALKYNIPVVRRITGGGAMFMEAGSVVTYSLYLPTELVAGMSFADSYAFLDDWTVHALREMGIDAYYKPLNDIESAGGKIGGAAQKRLGTGAILHHVTMSYDMNRDRMVEVLRIGREKLSDKGTKSANKRVDPLKAQTGATRAQIIDKMISVFKARYGLTKGDLTEDELTRAKDLVETKFATDDWLYRVP